MTGLASPVERVEAALEAIERLDPEVNAFTVVLADEARATAREIECALGSGEELGPLAGVPVAIKDHIWMRGAPATNGSLAYADFVPAVDCACVARLRGAGAVIVGKTNNPEFCYRGITDNALFGLTRNPWDLERTPGGSSGGSAAAVASGMVPLALGTDGGGSIRIPSSFCGVAGHKPTFGLVPKEPGFKNWKTLSVDGPIARTAGELAVMLAAMAGASSADDMTWPVPVGDLVGAAARAEAPAGRVAYSVDLGFAPVERDVRTCFERAIGALADAGWRLEAAAPPATDPTPLWNTIACVEGYASEGPLLASWGSRMSDGIAEIVEAGASISAGTYVDALHERNAYSAAWAGFFSSFDVLVTPTMQMTAFPVGQLRPETIEGRPVDPFFDDWCTLCLPANLAGLPATSVPAGVDSDGLPIGLQVMGPRWSDALTLRVAAAFEAASSTR
jgi:Asp-tRNA(Asn)/Glu-tRNA(Gln) amidotransferase A subunit family amidase